MENSVNYFTSFTITCTFISLVFLIYRVYLLDKQYKNDHERNRRQHVIDLHKLWIDNIDPKTRFAILLVKEFNEQKARDFWTIGEFRFPLEQKDLISAILDNCELKIEMNEIALTLEQNIKFRTIVVQYLNILETIFTSWRHNIGDRFMIEDEFGKNISMNNSDFPIEKIVVTSPGLPSIKMFIKHLKNKEGSFAKELIR